MRFFSNDSRQTSDDEARVDDQPETVKSDPVAVPQQRPSSPWAASPGTPSNRPTGNVTDTTPVTADSPGATADAVTTDDRPGGPLADAATDDRPDDRPDDLVDDRRARDRSRDGDPTDDDLADDDLADDELADDELAAREGTDGTTESRPDADAMPDTDTRPDHDTRPDNDGGPDAGGRPPFHEPAPVPTAFGAATVGGAVAASALANPITDADPDTHDTDRRSDATSGAADDRLAGPAHAADLDRPDDDRIGTATAHRADPSAPTSPSAPTDPSAPEGAPGASAAPGALAASGASGASAAVGMSSGAGTNGARTGDRSDVIDVALSDEGTFDGAVIAEPTTAVGVSEDSTTAGKGATAAATRSDERAAAVPSVVEQLPGTVAAPELGPLFGDHDAHSFRDRWRDVQLRFVDDPKTAADEAATLIDEAVDALAASIRSQKQQLNSGEPQDSPADTEQLRVRLRTYRNFLDRLLAL